MADMTFFRIQIIHVLTDKLYNKQLIKSEIRMTLK